MVRKSCFVAIVMLLVVLYANSQSSFLVNHIRDYRKSLSISTLQFSSEKYIYNDFGKIISANKNGKDGFLFQGQEFDVDFGIYHFPMRTYELSSYRFSQVDPMSQYFSPYIFVGNDPVNYNDEDGNWGKPLILYQEDHKFSRGMNLSTRELEYVTEDAHWVPLSDFVNGNVGALEEWNGRIFIKSHLSGRDGIEILLESADDPTKFRGIRGIVGSKRIQVAPKLFLNAADGKEFGKVLRRFSEERGEIKSVVFGGCQGKYAAAALRDGFMEESNKRGVKGRKIKIKGLEDDMNSLVHGHVAYGSSPYDVNPPELRNYLSPTLKSEFDVRSLEDGRKEFLGFKHLNEKTKKYESTPYMDEGETKRFVSEGKVPERFKSSFFKASELY